MRGKGPSRPWLRKQRALKLCGDDGEHAMPLCVVREAPRSSAMDDDGLGMPELVAMALGAMIHPTKSTGRKRRCYRLINRKKQR